MSTKAQFFITVMWHFKFIEVFVIMVCKVKIQAIVVLRICCSAWALGLNRQLTHYFLRGDMPLNNFASLLIVLGFWILLRYMDDISQSPFYSSSSMQCLCTVYIFCDLVPFVLICLTEVKGSLSNIIHV